MPIADIKQARQSLSARLSGWIVFFAAAIFLASLGYMAVVARKAVRREAILGANRILDNTVLRVNGILEDVQLVANNLEGRIYQHLDDPDYMFTLSRDVVLTNAFLNGCSISFEPYYFKEKGRYFSAYSNRIGANVYTQQEGKDSYQYFYLDWYLLPKLMGQPCWTEPYTDQEEFDDKTMDSKMMVSYCKPLIGNDGSFVGTLSMDISLEWLSKTISAVKPYPNSYSILVGRGGTFLVHPDPQLLFYQSIFTEGLVSPNPEIMKLGEDMQDWKEGMQEIRFDDVDCFVFYKPMMTTGWSVAIVCPESDVFGGFHRLRNIIIVIVLLGLLIMYLVFSKLIRKQLNPLRTLAVQAESIAYGNFNTVLPENTRNDEIGVLSRSFAEMQTSLVEYIDKLTTTTAKKERIEGELQIARSIQMDMVPGKFPPFPDHKEVDLYAFMSPAKEVGGDLYDYFIRDEQLYFCIGDVSGKGVPASLFMAVACNLFRVLSWQGNSPEEVARQINNEMSRHNEQLMFVTMFIGCLDLKTGCLNYCNCGHNPPVLFTPEPRFMSCLPNTPIGIMPGYEFEGQTMENMRDVRIFLYTDGLNEAEDQNHEEFGNERMMNALASLSPSEKAQGVVEKMHAAVASHVGIAEASDDLTMLCIKLA